MFAKVDSYEGHTALAVRYEDFPFEATFPKEAFVSEAAKGGFQNKKRTFGGCGLDCLLQQVVCSVLEGI